MRKLASSNGHTEGTYSKKYGSLANHLNSALTKKGAHEKNFLERMRLLLRPHAFLNPPEGYLPEDIIQDTIIKITPHLHKIKLNDHTIKSYAITTLTRLKSNYIKNSAYLNRPVQIEEENPNYADNTWNPQKKLFEKDLTTHAYAAIKKLPPLQAAIIRLSIQNTPYAEIARQLDKPIGTIKGELWKARQRVRKYLLGRGYTIPENPKS